MTRTSDDFCRKLMEEMDDKSCEEGRNPYSLRKMDPERMAGEFVRFFGLSLRPTMEEMTELLYQAGFGAVSGATFLPDRMRGVHYTSPDGGYDIHYLEDQPEGAREHTALHETYEIIYETLCDLHSDSPPPMAVCRQANRFAAAALMQPEAFGLLAQASGFDVTALHREYRRRAHASVTLRLGEVMREQPLMAVLYEGREWGGPDSRTVDFRVSVVVRTPGFGAQDCPVLCGWRGGMPRRGRRLSPGSLAERVANTARTAYAEVEPGSNGSGFGGVAVAARPVLLRGRLAKIAVVAVPHRDRTVLSPQLADASFDHLRGWAAAATP